MIKQTSVKYTQPVKSKYRHKTVLVNDDEPVATMYIYFDVKALYFHFAEKNKYILSCVYRN